MKSGPGQTWLLDPMQSMSGKSPKADKKLGPGNVAEVSLSGISTAARITLAEYVPSRSSQESYHAMAEVWETRLLWWYHANVSGVIGTCDSYEAESSSLRGPTCR